MYVGVDVDSAYIPSDDVVARDIEGEMIIVPLASGIGEEGDEIYTLNETGRSIWLLLDGRKLKEVIQTLTVEYEDPSCKIEEDVLGLVGELFKRKMVVKIQRSI